MAVVESSSESIAFPLSRNFSILDQDLDPQIHLLHHHLPHHHEPQQQQHHLHAQEEPSHLQQQENHQEEEPQQQPPKQQTPQWRLRFEAAHESQLAPQQPPLLHPRANSIAHLPNGTDPSSPDGHAQFSRDSMRELEDLLTKLNPLAKEFVPPSLRHAASNPDVALAAAPGDYRKVIASPRVQIATNFPSNLRSPHGEFPHKFLVHQKKNGDNPAKRRVNSRTSRAQREDSVRRTVYVSDIDQQVTEEQLAALFISCGQVVDCRVCGDPNSVLRFAFVEFTDEVGARTALSLAGTMLGYYPVRVLPSKTAILPVNPSFLPQNEDEREMCARTVYCTNIDKKVSQAEIKLFFESLCGEVARTRLLGDYHHATRIAFVEFVMAESAMAALNCSGAILGSLPLRVSPSKTPVRPRSPRLFAH